MKLAQRSRMPT